MNLIRGDLHPDEPSPTLSQVFISRQRVKRERVPIQVILQIEHQWEARTCEFGFVPRPIVILMRNQPADGSFYRGIFRADDGEQADQSPGRLRRRALPFALQRWI